MDLRNLSPDKLTVQIKKWEKELRGLITDRERNIDKVKELQAKIGEAKKMVTDRDTG